MFIALLWATEHGTTAALVKKGLYTLQKVASTYGTGCVCGVHTHGSLSAKVDGVCLRGKYVVYLNVSDIYFVNVVHYYFYFMCSWDMLFDIGTNLTWIKLCIQWPPTTSSPLDRQQKLSTPVVEYWRVLSRHIHLHINHWTDSGSRHLLAWHQGQPIHTVTTQQGSNSRGPLKSHYCTSLFKLVSQW